MVFGALLVLWSPWVGVWLWRKRGPWFPLTLREKLSGVLSLYLLVPLVLWGFSWFTGQTFVTLDWTGWGLLLLGLLLGWLGLVGVFGLAILLGWARWQAPNFDWQVVAGAGVLGLIVGGIEEWLFRGFMVEALLPYGLLQAALISSVIFALLHLIWSPDLITLRQIPGLTLMGLVLVWSVICAEGNLNLAWGLHAAWVWGITVLDSSQALSYPGKVPAWVTGLDGQPLAGLMGWSLLGLTAGVLYWLR